MRHNSEASNTLQHHSYDHEHESDANASLLHVSNQTHQHTHYHYHVTIPKVNNHCGTTTLSHKPTVRIFTKADTNYSLTIRDHKVVLALSNPNDDYQHWYKIEKYGSIVKDEEGCQAFSLVNKVTGQAIKHTEGGTSTHPSPNSIIRNPLFEDGLNHWSGKGCNIELHDSLADGKILPLFGNSFVSASNRRHSWDGVEHEITGRVELNVAYEVIASVRVSGKNDTSTDVILRATLWIQTKCFSVETIGIATVQASDKYWATMKGKFVLNSYPNKVFIYIEGAPSGMDILLNALSVKPVTKTSPSSPSDAKVCLVPYNPCKFDDSILWTESLECYDGYRAIRVVNNIQLNVDAFGGGEVHDGTPVILWDWNNGDHQKWKILPYCK
ncbi:hypothetical protein TanjilG_03852 [Lupinus angustifolius]|uniref:CBM-cenC domain-containing protein n=1 Tax=Lupinus angustifolius TaxID=3871 RepID=A0A1J7I072_LUPAN|nr:hypothetical protein TanjilG_03852 [Lupinus angustifolius]